MTSTDYAAIDEDRLLEECLEQPKRMARFREMLAQANSEVLYAKAKLKEVEARVNLAIRRDPQSHGVEKVTDKVVDAAVLVHRDYRDAAETYHRAVYKAEDLDGKVEVMRQRKNMLEAGVQLAVLGWFDNPKLPKGEEATKRMVEMDERRRQAIRRGVIDQ